MNTTNRISISVRITQEDADFIVELKIEGTNTPSEEIREPFKLARLSYAQICDYGSALTAQGQFLQVAKHEILHAKEQAGVHSYTVTGLLGQLSDLGVTLAADLPEEADLGDLRKHERELIWHIIRLAGSILQLAVTGGDTTYDDTVL